MQSMLQAFKAAEALFPQPPVLSLTLEILCHYCHQQKWTGLG